MKTKVVLTLVALGSLILLVIKGRPRVEARCFESEQAELRFRQRQHEKVDLQRAEKSFAQGKAFLSHGELEEQAGPKSEGEVASNKEVASGWEKASDAFVYLACLAGALCFLITMMDMAVVLSGGESFLRVQFWETSLFILMPALFIFALLAVGCKSVARRSHALSLGSKP